MHVCYNFSVIDEKEFNIPIKDRAFQYGDGLFETMVYKNGQIRWLDDHWKRLATGCNVLSYTLPPQFSQNALNELALELISRNQHSGDVKLKLIVWRQMGGLFTPEKNDVNFILFSEDFRPNFKAITKIGLSEKVNLSFSILSQLKTTSALHYVVAGLEKKEKQLDELILTDLEGNISEGTSSNIFWVNEGKFFTPSTTTGCLPGITRNKLIQHLLASGIPVKEVKSLVKDLLKAESIFFTNVNGIRFVTKYENRELPSHHYMVDTFDF